MRTIGKRLLPALLCVLLCLSGCGRPAAEEPRAPSTQSYGSVIELTFEDALRACTDLIRAEYVERHDHNGSYELEFRVLEVLKGATEAQTIFVYGDNVRVGPANTDGSYPYEKGLEYLLVLERKVSVYQEHDVYLQLGDIYIPLDNYNASMMYHQALKAHAEDADLPASETDFFSYVRQTAAEGKNEKPYLGTDYCRSEDLTEVLAESPFVLQVKVEELLIAGRQKDRETYWCSVQKRLRGETPDGLWVVFPYGAVEIGGEYLMLLNRSSDDSLIYTMTSRVSMIPLTDTASVQTVYRAAAD